MSNSGHQYQHGVTKNIVEGVGGVIIGAAAVLLLARIFKGGKAVAAVALPMAAKKTTEVTAKAKAEPAQAKTPPVKSAPKASTKASTKAATKAATKATAEAEAAQPEAVAAPIVKRASRARAKPAVSKVESTKSESSQPEVNES